eukprot:CAMPEP_0176205052 /NCGR_PEP_ID=MMETSP0121_2-20121125/11399_1 /TAXON_ID=160619 /ORGANISM="Kryptoperidinium foliaceum, Strain CCMP 1326" /LENGTH=309 /DNA_ID=CAMNT_0017543981 /DNA_START=517 /DNA_END=1441 /DNA_ORIENTATION=+
MGDIVQGGVTLAGRSPRASDDGPPGTQASIAAEARSAGGAALGGLGRAPLPSREVPRITGDGIEPLGQGAHQADDVVELVELLGDLIHSVGDLSLLQLQGAPQAELRVLRDHPLLMNAWPTTEQHTTVVQLPFRGHGLRHSPAQQTEQERAALRVHLEVQATQCAGPQEAFIDPICVHVEGGGHHADEYVRQGDGEQEAVTNEDRVLKSLRRRRPFAAIEWVQDVVGILEIAEGSETIDAEHDVLIVRAGIRERPGDVGTRCPEEEYDENEVQRFVQRMCDRQDTSPEPEDLKSPACPQQPQPCQAARR